jgi:methanogenic corrinoid protein MtbC1
MAKLFPRVAETPKHGRRFLGTCVEGELHEVGIRMVCDVFELRGWRSVYLGSANPIATILQTAGDQRPDAIGISIARDANLAAVTHLIKQLRARMPRPAPILVGGRPFNAQPDLWRQVESDGSAANATEAVALAEKLLTGAVGSST